MWVVACLVVLSFHHLSFFQAEEVPEETPSVESPPPSTDEQPEPRIIGGQDADVGEWPWHVALYIDGVLVLTLSVAGRYYPSAGC